MNGKIDNPYIGPRTFQENERDRFFGRDRESSELRALVLSEQLVLLYAQSGAGKSSLINTRLIPELKNKDIEVLTGRVGGDAPTGLKVDNVFVFNLLRSLVTEVGNVDELADKDIVSFLASQAMSRKETSGQAYKRRIIIIDQFEELFNTHHEEWEKRDDFFQQVARALEEEPRLKVLFVMREDFIAYLDPFVHLLPERLRMRYYMQPLEFDAALEAVEGPVKISAYSREYAPGVAKKLIDDIRRIKVTMPDGVEEHLGQFVEPLFLQVICYDLWENLRPDGAEITEDDLQQIGNVNEFLGNYYSKRMKIVAEAQQVSERSIRIWFSEKLIAEDGTRALVKETAGGMSAGVIRSLSDLVRAEQRGGSTFYELTHDRLVEPILANNKEWDSKNANLLQQGAALWQRQGHSDGLLLRGRELRDAEGWAKLNPLTDDEKTYLESCLKSRSDARERHRLNQRLKKNFSTSIFIIIIALFFIFIASVFGVQSYTLNRQAKSQELSKSSEAAFRMGAKEDAIILAYQALKNYPYTGEAEAALMNAVAPPKRLADLYIEGVLDANLARNETSIITINSEGAIQFWDANSGKLIDTIFVKGPISYARFSVDGRKVLTNSGNEEVSRLWDTEKGTQLFELKVIINGASFSSDGKRVAIQSFPNDDLEIWDLENGDRISTLPPVILDDRIRSLSLNPNGSKAVAFDYADPEHPEAGIWDADTGEQMFSLDVAEYIIFSPDGERVAVFNDNLDVTIWDANTGKRLNVVEFSREVIALAEEVTSSNSEKNIVFNSDNTLLVIGISSSILKGANNVSVWDLTDNRKLFNLYGNSGAITRATFSPNGGYVATAGDDHIVRVWDIQDKKERLGISGRNDILTITNSHNTDASPDEVMFSQDSSHIFIVWDDGGIEYWSIPASRLELLSIAEGQCGKCEFTYEQRIAYDVHDWRMKIYDFSDFFLLLWISPFYFLLGWVIFRGLFSDEAAGAPSMRTPGSEWLRFFIAVIINGMLPAVLVTGMFFILMPEASFETPVQTRNINLELRSQFLFVIPVLLFPGAMYCHLTRYQLNGWWRAKHIFISLLAGGLALIPLLVIVLSVVFLYFLSSNDILLELSPYVIVGFLSGWIINLPFNFLGSLLYIFVAHPILLRNRSRVREETDF